MNFSVTRKQALIALLLLCGIILLLGLPFSGWWLGGDDFHGIFLGYKSKSWQDIFYFFYEGNTNQGVGCPGGEVLTRSDFLGVYYRPFHCIFLTLQYWLFGTHGFGYFLCNVIVHAINTALLFLLCSSFTSIATATLSALLFAFHPQIALRFGAVVNFHYYVNVLYVLLIALSLKKYLDTGKSIYFPLACLFFALSLFTRETTLALPPIIGLCMLLYTRRNEQWTLPKLFKHLPQAIIFGLPFALISIAFLGLRLYLYPLAQTGAHNNFLPYHLEGSSYLAKFPELLVMLYDFLWLSWLPWGNKFLKLTLLGPAILLLISLWWRCNKKVVVAVLLGSSILMLWPGLISFYSPRYFYEAASLLLVMYIFLAKGAELPPLAKKLLISTVAFFCCFLAFYTFFNFSRRELKLALMDKATHELAANPTIKDRPLCFLCTPNDGFAGGNNPAIFWILLDNRYCPLFFDAHLAITQRNANVVQTTPWCIVASNFFEENYISIAAVPGGFRIHSLDPNKVVFHFPISTTPTYGTKIIHAKTTDKDGDAITDFTFLVPKYLLEPTATGKMPAWITWDMTEKTFKILPPPLPLNDPTNPAGSLTETVL